MLTTFKPEYASNCSPLTLYSKEYPMNKRITWLDFSEPNKVAICNENHFFGGGISFHYHNEKKPINITITYYDGSKKTIVGVTSFTAWIGRVGEENFFQIHKKI